MQYPTGSVISGTHDTGELLRAFADELLKLGTQDRDDGFNTSLEAIPFYGLIREAQGTNPEDADASSIVDELITSLDTYAPPYFYFGAHPHDGADFGFWLSESALYDFDGLRVSDTSKVPDNYNGEVMHVNDHGNATLYFAQAGHDLVEVWAVV